MKFFVSVVQNYYNLLLKDKFLLWPVMAGWNSNRILEAFLRDNKYLYVVLILWFQPLSVSTSQVMDPLSATSKC